MKVTKKLLESLKACTESLHWLKENNLEGQEHTVVLSKLESHNKRVWSLWLRKLLASAGSTEERSSLRNDPSEFVRELVAKFGTTADRKALRSDSEMIVRMAVARYGSAQDRLILIDDRSVFVRRAAGEVPSVA